jgi:hypothetical protein
MNVLDLIERLKQLDPESQIEFVSLTEYGFQEYMEVVSEECLIREDSGSVQLIISGEAQ